METEIIKAKDNSPAEMIKMAVSSGANLDQLEKLLSLQERWEANEARKAYNKAIADFKLNPPKIDKDKKVGYTTAKGKVGYSHASLYNVVDKITIELSKHGLSASWKTKQVEKTITVTCLITHMLGHSEETTLSAEADDSGAKNSIQALGSTITYLERYTLLAATGLATFDQDNDNKTQVETLDENKLKIIKDQLLEVGADEKSFLNYMRVESLEKILQSDYLKAKTALEAKKREKKAVSK